MPVTNFPPLELADEHGLLALGGDLQVSTLLLAYSRGIFPWPISHEYPLAWFSPDPRGLVLKENFHLPRSLKKFMNKKPYKLMFNRNFDAVIEHCADVHQKKASGETWITPEIIMGYKKLYRSGHAFSAEAYNQKDELVGGLYGVHLGSYLSGESMFFLEDNASKFVLASLLQHLFKNGIAWLDTQMVTPVVGSLGGQEIPRKLFIEKLKLALENQEGQKVFDSKIR